MLTYDALARHRRALRSLTGFDRAGFEALFTDYRAAADRLRGRPGRPAGGRPGFVRPGPATPTPSRLLAPKPNAG